MEYHRLATERHLCGTAIGHEVLCLRKCKFLHLHQACSVLGRLSIAGYRTRTPQLSLYSWDHQVHFSNASRKWHEVENASTITICLVMEN